MLISGTVREVYNWAVEARRTPASTEPRYGIARGYRHRGEAKYFDDTCLRDEWQREVYVAARTLASETGVATIYDVGCGSGYKLVNYLGDYDTTGFDIEPTLTFLKSTYPDRKWRAVSFDDRTIAPADLVVCSDVIEHVSDPDALLDFLGRVAKHRIVLSTPERNLVYGRSNPRRRGPPRNPTHVREWSFDELRAYVSSKFGIIEHRVTNRDQATQMIVCQPRIGPSGRAPDSAP